MESFRQYIVEKVIELHPNMAKLKLTELSSPIELRQGLMYVDHLPENEGMLFIHPKEEILSFWAKNCLIPIDLAYVSYNGIIGEIKELIPGDETHVISNRPYKYAVEVNRGWFKRNNIGVGDRIL